MAEKLILGSNSPRRQEILRLAGYKFEIAVSHEEELPDISLSVYNIPEDLARQKADHILAGINTDDFILVTADTVVIIDDEIIGKPKDLKEAKNFLQKLGGRTHEVVTGVCVSGPRMIMSFSDLTKVSFSALSSSEIDNYVQNYEVMDKAGAYAIQEGIGLTSVESVEGSYYNVMGLPIHKLYKALAGLDILPQN